MTEEGPRGHLSSHFTPQYFCQSEKRRRESQHTHKLVGFMQDIIQGKYGFEQYHFQQNSIQVEVVANSGLADSCHYLEPDVGLSDLGQEKGRAKWQDGRKMKVKNLKKPVLCTPLGGQDDARGSS